MAPFRKLRPAAAGLSIAACFALLALPPQPALAFWGALGKLGSAAGKAGGAAGTVGKGAAAGAGAGAAAGMADDAARGAGKLGAADAAVATHAALPPEVARYLSKPANTLTAADTADMMSMYQKMVRDAGKSGDFTVVEHLPSTAGQGKTLNAPAQANTAAQPAAAKTPPKSYEVPLHAVQLLAHAAKGGNAAAKAEVNRKCEGFRKQGVIPPAWQEACKTAA